jgi:predicted MFS family arabinose efflux permease
MAQLTSAEALQMEGMGVRPGRTLALAGLTAIGAINFIDRQVLSVLVEPIRADLHLTDTQFGLLTGLSFALFYAAMGVPVAMLADRTNRVRLVAGACLIWSLFTGACGFATSFWQLALARFGVGVGEAGGTAPSLSILADYYPPEQRPAVIGLFSVNGPIGVFLGASLGGWVAGQFGWRFAFFGLALIGALAAVALAVLVREPSRGVLDHRPAGEQGKFAMSLADTVRLFLSRPTLRCLLFAFGLASFVSYGLLNWIPAYLMRVQHMPLSEVARWFGPAAGLCMGLGIWGGGALVNWGAKRSVKAYAYVPGVAMVLVAPDAGVGADGEFLAALARAHARAHGLLHDLHRARARTCAEPVACGGASDGHRPPVAGVQHRGARRRPAGDRLAQRRARREPRARTLKLALLGAAPAAVLAAVGYYATSRHIVRDAAATTET